ncbi:MAG TPA: hypothetical protein VLV50_00630 [Stellaceae bacterium]|nr:hypothetical protein [Stellaceae bacterium]
MAVLAVSVLALSACAAPRWQKPGADANQVSADFSDCNSMAQAAVARDSNIDSDILASRGRDWQDHGTLDQHRTIIASETGERSDAVLNACMAEKGYSAAK